MRDTGALGRALSADGRRLKPREVVAEFDKYLHDELDLMREAANAASCAATCRACGLLLVPEVVWDHCAPERDRDGAHARRTRSRQVERLRAAGVDIREAGRATASTIFFTQVFRDGFFHADMHPGNIQVSLDPGHLRALHRARLRHRRHADRGRQELPGAELHRVLPPRLPPRRRAARRERLGAGRDARRRAWKAPSARCASRTSTGR